VMPSSRAVDLLVGLKTLLTRYLAKKTGTEWYLVPGTVQLVLVAISTIPLVLQQLFEHRLLQLRYQVPRTPSTRYQVVFLESDLLSCLQKLVLVLILLQ